jgi:hypothetical protein
MVWRPVNKKVSPEAETLEFKPIPGYEEEWAGFSYVERSRLWDALGVVPVGLWFVLSLVIAGVSSCG